ncbi:hypothetical protein [Carboxydothermus hydrogenoformans]|uniref:Uncharacterized protein n=1 Tax=Carboxydothermus hydrogenoformans (strain ATCC BAA-161 / DSM 6008 / Z-2901) TaxID=246194 RepID=Q3AA89_CARHZ|nr:hypothetical protein [Carboxydothermus hydrogenoformans]ABB14465.1 hypothetical protein CHY_2131 [Carboxydothermus hydrogenoformans Z-2901]
MNDIFEKYGLDPSAVKKTDIPVIRDVTVRNLEMVIQEAKKLPKTIIVCADNGTNVKNSNNTNDITTQATTATTGTATVSYNAQITFSLIMKYSATGKYYKSGTTKYWTAAYGANIEVASPLLFTGGK